MSAQVPTDIKARLGKVQNLPSVPQIIVKIKQVSEDPKSSPADLANCILSDHQLTTRILRMANSTYYGSFAGKINTVTHAIVLMGFRAVHNIAISMAVYEVVNKVSENAKFDTISFWSRSLSAGVVAKYLAHNINQSKLIEVAFIAGFLHDIGQAILAGLYPEKYDQIIKMDQDQDKLWETERVILGTDHCEVGGYIAGKWNLPKGLSSAISQHHRIDVPPTVRSKDLLVDLVYLADLLHPHVMAGTDPDSPAYMGVKEQCRTLVDIGDESLDNLLIECREQIEEIARDLEINIESKLDDGSAVNQAAMAEIQQQLNNQEVQLAFLRNATTALMEAKAEDEILQVVCEAIFRGLAMERVVVFGYDQKWTSFTGRVGFGYDSQQTVQKMSFSARSGLFKHLREVGNPVSFVNESREVPVTKDELSRLQTSVFIAVPIKIIDEVRFVVFADAPSRNEPINDDLMASVMSLTNQAGMVLERNLLRAKLGSARF